MMDTLGPKNVLAYAKRFGFEEDFPPYLPIALGAGDATLLEMTSAYTAFPESGRPDEAVRGARTSRTATATCSRRIAASRRDVIRADTAYVMTNLLRGVLSLRGTGARAAEHGRAVAARRQDRHGRRQHRRLVHRLRSRHHGRRLGRLRRQASRSAPPSRASLAALPIWMEFMKAYIDGRPDKDDPPEFEAPGNIVFLPVDKTQRRRAARRTRPAPINEAFIAGTQPGAGAASLGRQP